MTMLQSKMFEWQRTNSELYQALARRKRATDAGAPPQELELVQATIHRLEQACANLFGEIERLRSAPQ